MESRWAVIWGVIAGFLTTASAHAWDATGHQVVARIAWDQMQPRTRQVAMDLLKAAPQDAGLLSLLSDDARSLPDREREFFARASTWPDIVRDEHFPGRRKAYHHSTWHYINYFWEKPGPNARPRDREDLKPDPENVVERLQHFQTALGDTSREKSTRAIDLAWVLHLVGDIHQPLHTSARVTPEEPKGDKGGNDFKLNGQNNLHAYWDHLLDQTYPKVRGETEDATISRVAGTIAQQHPFKKMQKRLHPGDFEEWAKEGFQTSKKTAYPKSLKRNEAPSQSYAKKADKTAEPAIALAGYRLAKMLDKLLGR